MILHNLLQFLRCPECRHPLKEDGEALQCERCGIVVPVLNGIPRFHGTTNEPIIEFDERGIRTPAHWTGWRRRNYEFFVQKLERVKADSTVIDIGAGTSPFYELFEPYRAVRVDFAPYRGVDFLTDLNKALPVRDESFDLVVMSNLLEHIPEPLNLLRECRRILKTDGGLIMTVPFLIKVHQVPHDYLRYTEYMLERLFRESGFSEFEISKIGNIIDVNIQISSSLYHFVMKDMGVVNRIRREIIRFLYYLHYFSIRSIIRVADAERRGIEDTVGYPHGYGCVAIKKK